MNVIKAPVPISMSIQGLLCICPRQGAPLLPHRVSCCFWRSLGSWTAQATGHWRGDRLGEGWEQLGAEH